MEKNSEKKDTPNWLLIVNFFLGVSIIFIILASGGLTIDLFRNEFNLSSIFNSDWLRLIRFFLPFGIFWTLIKIYVAIIDKDNFNK
jgi:hypothetical protein